MARPSPCRVFLSLLKHTVNRVAVPLARSGYGPVAVVRHVGRRTGARYETPLILARTPDGFVAELTYGPDVDWYRNIVAAGRGTVLFGGTEFVIDGITPCPTAEGLAAFGRVRGTVLRLLRRREFRRLHVSSGSRHP